MGAPSSASILNRPNRGDGRSIGIFDSGVGGLSVLREIQALLPGEDLVYVADSGNCPYGLKRPDEIRHRAIAIADFLVEQDVKAIIVACNTATSAALRTLRERLSLPIVGMEPGVKPAAAATRSGVVGVLATGATLRGEPFARLIEQFANGVEVLTQACPGLVEQVEMGDLSGPHIRALVARYVDPLLARHADVLVLGCTHYPFLREAIASHAGADVTLVDTGPAVARQVARVLKRGDLLNPSEAGGSVRFVASGEVDRVATVIARLRGHHVAVEMLPM